MATLKVIKTDYTKRKNGCQKLPQFEVVIAETGEALTGIENLSITINDRGNAILTLRCLDFKLHQKIKSIGRNK